MGRSVCDVMISTLAELGVTEIFGVPGDAINNLIDSLRRQDRILFRQVRHEETGAFAASAKAKLTGNLAVCCGTSGPGAVHLLNGLYDAKTDHAPVLAITGQVETAEIDHDFHQEVDLQALFANVAVYRATLRNVEDAPRVIAAACQAAISRRGVAHIAIPSDLAGADTTDAHYPVVVEQPQTVPIEHDLKRAADILNSHNKIAVLAGIGTFGARAELIQLAETLQAPIIHTLRAKELLADNHPLNIGGLGLLGGSPGVEAISDCDALLMVGTDFPYRDFLPQDVPVVQIEMNPLHLGRRCPLAVGLVGHALPSIKALLPHLQPHQDGGFLQQAQKHRRHQLKHYDHQEAKQSAPIHPARLARLLSDQAKNDAVFTCDTGEVTVWGARHLRLHDEQRFVLSANLASMAFALPGALGAQCAYPDRQVIALCGDGGFAMLMADTLTAVKYGLPVKLVIFNNRKLGLIQVEQESEGLPEYAVDLHNPDFAAFARLCGAHGFSVTEDEHLETTLREFLTAPGPALLDVAIDGSVLPFPPQIKVQQAFNFTLAKLKEVFGQTGG